MERHMYLRPMQLMNAKVLIQEHPEESEPFSPTLWRLMGPT